MAFAGADHGESAGSSGMDLQATMLRTLVEVAISTAGSKASVKDRLWVITRAVLESSSCAPGLCDPPVVSGLLGAAAQAHSLLDAFTGQPQHALSGSLKMAGGALPAKLSKKLKHLSTSANALRHCTPSGATKLVHELKESLEAAAVATTTSGTWETLPNHSCQAGRTSPGNADTSVASDASLGYADALTKAKTGEPEATACDLPGGSLLRHLRSKGKGIGTGHQLCQCGHCPDQWFGSGWSCPEAWL
eukprot:gb/GFBE01048143.1/.p1 GENE.gb/GFBE01048143.1/~~gb/GFBE01048143.1/.p1  ORF type:complete len:248 (+),score=23.63 gb/GFBE01048143.1/:1-744(+)